MNKELSPGEARNRQRQRRQAIYLAIATIAGGVIGFSIAFFDQGAGSVFSGNWEDLKLDPAIAIAVAIGFLLAFLALPMSGFFMIDELKREQNLIGFTGGCLGVLSGFPVWATLYAGGFLPPPTAFGVFAIAFVSMLVSFLYAKWRS